MWTTGLNKKKANKNSKLPCTLNSARQLRGQTIFPSLMFCSEDRRIHTVRPGPQEVITEQWNKVGEKLQRRWVGWRGGQPGWHCPLLILLGLGGGNIFFGPGFNQTWILGRLWDPLRWPWSCMRNSRQFFQTGKGSKYNRRQNQETGWSWQTGKLG